MLGTLVKRGCSDFIACRARAAVQMIKIRKFNNEWREQVLRNWPEALANSTGVMRQLLSAVERLRQSCHPQIIEHGIQPGDFDVLVTLRISGKPMRAARLTFRRVCAGCRRSESCR